MSEQLQSGMAEAMRLMQEGRLAESTAIIQRTLGGGLPGGAWPPASPASRPGSADEDTIEATFVVDETTQPTAPSRPEKGKYTLRQPPAPPRDFRGMPRPPGNLFSGLSGVTAAPSAPDPVATGGQFVERSYTNQAGIRSYKLYIPSGYVGQAVPLVVMLHGCTQSPNDFATGTRMNALAETNTFLVAYPAQASGDNMQKCWNWFKDTDQRRDSGEPSLIAGITREVAEEYGVADGEVYIAGMSAGGAMAAIMGATYPDLYAAIGIHSGLAAGASHDLPSALAAMQRGGPATLASRGVPAIIFHGDRDTTVSPRNADHLLAHLTVVGDQTSRMTKRQGQAKGGYTYTCTTQQDVDGLSVVEQWTVHGLGHTWSGGDSRGSYTDHKGPDASAEMVRFFQQHSPDGQTE